MLTSKSAGFAAEGFAERGDEGLLADEVSLGVEGPEHGHVGDADVAEFVGDVGRGDGDKRAVGACGSARRATY